MKNDEIEKSVIYPQKQEENSSLALQFALETEMTVRRPVRMVLDLGELREVVGIEIVNLYFQLGRSCLGKVRESAPTGGEGTHYNYDEICDSFYLRLRGGRSVTQKAVDGTVLVDERGAIVGLNVSWSPPV